MFFLLFIILKVTKYENIQILVVFSQFFILFHPFQKWTFLRMSNSKKITKSFFPIFYHFFSVFYFITFYHNKIKNRYFCLFYTNSFQTESLTYVSLHSFLITFSSIESVDLPIVEIVFVK